MRHLSLPRIAVVPLCVALLAVGAAAAASKGAEVPADRLVPPTGHGTAVGLDSALTDVALASRRGATAGLTTARKQLLDVSGRKVRRLRL